MFICPADPAQTAYWNDHSRPDDVFRLAILSTPRTGNTWLRRLLDGVYSLPQVVQDNPCDIEWEQLPNRCILQLHWWRDPPLLEKLRQYGFRLITSCRHPLDVLISVLHFASVHNDTASWVAGFGGDERSIGTATPRSPAFLDYALSRRADILLNISRQWSEDPGCISVRYESLVEETSPQLTALCNALHPAPAEAVASSVAANTLENQRQLTANQHCWRGQPGLWRRLLPAREVHRIVKHHKDVFETLGYPCEPDRKLTDQRADANWYELEFASLKEECRLARSQVLKLEQRLSNDLSQQRLEGLESQVAALHTAIANLQSRTTLPTPLRLIAGKR